MAKQDRNLIVIIIRGLVIKEHKRNDKKKRRLTKKREFTRYDLSASSVSIPNIGPKINSLFRNVLIYGNFSICYLLCYCE